MRPSPQTAVLGALALLNVPLYLVLLPAALVHWPGQALPLLGLTLALTVLYLAAVYAAERAAPGLLWLIVGAGLLYRCVLLPCAPALSNDPYRYVWDARVAMHGNNPYAAVPTSAALRPLRDRVIYPRMNFYGAPSLYPPGAQALFGLAYRLTPDSVVGIKLLLFLCDLLAATLLVVLLWARGQPVTRGLIYLWCPTAIVEFAQTGHLDAAAIAAVLAALLADARGHPWLAGACLGLATLIKLYPAILLPALLGRREWRPALACGGVVAAGYGLAWRVYGGPALGGLGTYLAHGSQNGVLAALSRLGAHLGLSAPVRGAGPTALALGALMLWVWRQRWQGRGDPAALMLVSSACYLALAPVTFPWYAPAMVPLAALALGRPAVPSWLVGLPTICLLFSCLVLLEYSAVPGGLLVTLTLVGMSAWVLVCQARPPAPSTAPPSPTRA